MVDYNIYEKKLAQIVNEISISQIYYVLSMDYDDYGSSCK